MRNDLRFAMRSLRRERVFSLIAILTLGLGVGATTSIFSLFYQILLRSLPVPEAEQLVLLHSDPPWVPGGMTADNMETVFSYPMYLRLRDGANNFRGLAARSGAAVEVTTKTGTDRAQAEVVSGNFFQVLGLQPRAGRLLEPQDDSLRGGNPVTVLSYAYWANHFGASAAALNHQIIVNGHAFLIVGVTPESFKGFISGNTPDLFVPISMKAAVSPGWQGFDDPGSQWVTIFGRLKSDVSRRQAQASLTPLWTATLREELNQINYRGDRRRLLAKQIELRPAAKGINQLEAEWKKPLTALFAMAALLLLIACANVANLLVARTVARSRDTAVRVAIGADRRRIVQHVLIESLILAFAGGITGVGFAYGFVKLLVNALPPVVTGTWIAADLNFPVLGFSLLVVFISVLLFGVLPSVQSARSDPMHALRDQTSGASVSAVRTKWRQALVAGQFALSLTLLVGAGLFAKTLHLLLSHDPGYRAEGVLSFSVDPTLSGYSVENGLNLYRELQERFKQLPGVQSVSIGEFGPLFHAEAMTNVTVEGFQSRHEDDAGCDTNTVGAGFFRTLGTPLISGREFNEHDRAGSQKVAIVNEAFVRHFFRGQSATGKHMAAGAGHPLDTEIVGVVRDTQNMNLRDAAKPMYYTPFEQSYARSKRIRGAAFFIRSSGDMAALKASVRNVVRSADEKLPVYDMATMEDRVDEAVYLERVSSILATTFGLLALALAAIGLYGVVAYAVVRRIPEIGIRLALGAVPRQIIQMIMKEIAVIACMGVALGIPAAYCLAQLMRAQLYGVKATDAGVFAAAILVFLVTATLAGVVPAARASMIDPKTALRYE